MPIRRLPEELVNQIAAGEVVERPAAALRELVENALDAGATRIEADLERGGKELLVVTDDGSGIPKDEIPLALERHATSKLSAAEDLHRIRTLGFRGEALPSIASVSKFRLLTRTAESEHGWEIVLDGGRRGTLTPKPAPRGTRVEAAGLFYNTPARRKFLKTDATELSHCLDFLTRLALVRPQIGFAARHGGQLVLDAPPTSDPAERAAQLLGSKSRGELFALLWEGEAAGDRVRWEGLLGSPQILSASTKSIYLFVEGRPIRDRALQHAVQNAYREVIVERKYPTVVLNLRIDPEAVDVNIHPTKAEVRFRAPQAVYGTLYKAVTAVLEEAPWAPAARRGYQVPLEDFSQRQERIAEAVGGYQAHRKYYSGEAFAGAPSPGASAGNAWRADEVAPLRSFPQAAVRQTPSEAPRRRGFFESLDIVGQFHGEYLICQSDSALYLIDQHAAHERVAYERLRGRVLSADDASGRGAQALLVPQPVELPAAEAAALLEAAEMLSKMGFEIEDYGAGAVLVRQVPSVFSGRSVPEVLKECAQELLEYGTTSASERAVEELCARMACHSVIRGPTALSEEEARSLLRQMDEIDFAAHCPHGRPVVKEFPISEIERLFKRTL